MPIGGGAHNIFRAADAGRPGCHAREIFYKKGRGPAVSVPFPSGTYLLWVTAIPQGRVLLFEDSMDKDSKEALQVAKELTAKFIETRTVSPGNFAEIFPAVFRVVHETVRQCSARQEDA